MRVKVLMVCLGNICRSPLAEGILKSKTTHLNKLLLELSKTKVKPEISALLHPLQLQKCRKQWG